MAKPKKKTTGVKNPRLKWRKKMDQKKDKKK